MEWSVLVRCVRYFIVCLEIIEGRIEEQQLETSFVRTALNSLARAHLERIYVLFNAVAWNSLEKGKERRL